MNKSVLAVLSLAVSLVAALPAQAGQQDFELVNKTGFVIAKVFVSESAKASWEEDVLGEGVLGEDESRVITFDGYADTVCKFDVRIVDPEENTYDVAGLDLCTTQKVTFGMRGKAVVYLPE
jgi:hypothetical protein